MNKIELELQALKNQKAQLENIKNTFPNESVERFKIEKEIIKNDIEIENRLKKLKVI